MAAELESREQKSLQRYRRVANCRILDADGMGRGRTHTARLGEEQVWSGRLHFAG